MVTKTHTIIIVVVILLASVVGGIMLVRSKPQKGESVGEKLKLKGNMKIESPAFAPNQNIPSQYTCDGQNVNPPLTISDVPKEAKSLALIMDDPDAPVGLWVHWTMWNVTPHTTKIAENSVPQGAVEGMTNFGKAGYGGPCPPFGTHRYFFKLYALDTLLDLPQDTDKTDLESAMVSHVLASAELMGFYSRSRR